MNENSKEYISDTEHFEISFANDESKNDALKRNSENQQDSTNYSSNKNEPKQWQEIESESNNVRTGNSGENMNERQTENEKNQKDHEEEQKHNYKRDEQENVRRENANEEKSLFLWYDPKFEIPSDKEKLAQELQIFEIEEENISWNFEKLLQVISNLKGLNYHLIATGETESNRLLNQFINTSNLSGLYIYDTSLEADKMKHQKIIIEKEIEDLIPKIRERIQMNLDLADKEIIIKCSIEEVSKAFFKEDVIVWYDPDVDSDENHQYIALLKNLCDVDVFTFTEWQKARDYIQTSQAVCHVITSETNGELFVKEIFSIQNAIRIYVFHPDKEYHSTWVENYEKVTCAETNIENILDQIQKNLIQWHQKASSHKLDLPAYAPIFNESDKSQMNHLHRFLKVIPNFKNRGQAKKDFINLSKAIFTSKKDEKLISDFEQNYNEYNKEQILRWYTKPSFFFRVINNCLRIATSDSIQYDRFPLRDLQSAIKDQYLTKSKNFNGLLYRAAYMSGEEWRILKENVSLEIEMHGFLSCLKNKKVAFQFMGFAQIQKMFATIIVPKGPNEEEQGFAEIEEFSKFPKETEALFNVRSRFTILETEEKYSEEYPFRHLVLLYGAQGFRKFMAEQNPIQEIFVPKIENISCNNCQIPSYAIPEKFVFIPISGAQKEACYCWRCISENDRPFLCIPITDNAEEPRIAKIKGFLLINPCQIEIPFYGYECCKCKVKKQKIYFTCTDCYQEVKKWCVSCFKEGRLECLESGHNIILEKKPFRFWFEKMSELELSSLKFKDDILVKNENIFQQGEMYFESHLYAKAIEFYDLYIQQNETKSKDSNLAICYSNLGDIYRDLGEYKKAIEYYSKSLEIKKSIYPESHLEIAASFNKFGLVYESLREYSKALKFHLDALDIRKSQCGESHQETATSYHYIASTYQRLEDFEKAREYQLKALEIRRSVYGENHPETAKSYNNLALMYANFKEYDKALEFHNKALAILMSIYGERHPDVASLYNNIGLVYQGQEENDEAMKWNRKALEIVRLVYGENHPRIGIAYSNIASTYEGKGWDVAALDYHLKALRVLKKFYDKNNPQMVAVYESIIIGYKNLRKFEKATEYEAILKNNDNTMNNGQGLNEQYMENEKDQTYSQKEYSIIGGSHNLMKFEKVAPYEAILKKNDSAENYGHTFYEKSRENKKNHMYHQEELKHNYKPQYSGWDDGGGEQGDDGDEDKSLVIWYDPEFLSPSGQEKLAKILPILKIEEENIYWKFEKLLERISNLNEYPCHLIIQSKLKLNQFLNMSNLKGLYIYDPSLEVNEIQHEKVIFAKEIEDLIPKIQERRKAKLHRKSKLGDK